VALALLTVEPLGALHSREGNRTADGGAACRPAQLRRKPHCYVVSAPPDVSSGAWVILGITTGLWRGSEVGCAICREFLEHYLCGLHDGCSCGNEISWWWIWRE